MSNCCLLNNQHRGKTMPHWRWKSKSWRFYSVTRIRNTNCNRNNESLLSSFILKKSICFLFYYKEFYWLFRKISFLKQWLLSINVCDGCCLCLFIILSDEITTLYKPSLGHCYYKSRQKYIIVNNGKGSCEQLINHWRDLLNDKLQTLCYNVEKHGNIEYYTIFTWLTTRNKWRTFIYLWVFLHKNIIIAVKVQSIWHGYDILYNW